MPFDPETGGLLIDLNPYAVVFEVVKSILGFFGIDIDPISALIGAFSGRPKEEATEEAGLRLVRSPNKTVRALGATIYGLAQQGGFILSRRFDLTHIFIPLIADAAYALDLDQDGFNTLFRTIDSRDSGAIPLSFPTQAQTTRLAGAKRLGRPETFNVDSRWTDSLQKDYESYIKRADKFNPPPPPPPPPKLPTQTGGEGDELTDWAQKIDTDLLQLASTLKQPQDNPDPVTCAQLTTATGAISAALGAIADVLKPPSGDGGTPVDARAIASAIGSLAATVATLVNPDPVTCAQVTAAAKQIADAISTGGVGDLSAVVEQLKRAADTAAANRADSDYSLAEIRALVDIGALSPEQAQLLTGSIHVKVNPLITKHGMESIEKTLGPVGRGIAEVFAELVGLPSSDDPRFRLPAPDDVRKFIRDQFGAAATAFSDIIERDLEATPVGDPDAARKRAAAALGDAFEFGVGAHITAVAAEAAYPLKHLGLPTIAALMAEFSGFAELVGAFHGPLITNAIRTQAQHEFAAKFRPSIPGDVVTQILFSRGILDSARARTLLAQAGFGDGDIDSLLAGAFRPLSPFVLRGALATGALADDELRDAMTYGGMRPVDQDRMIRVGKELALGPFKQKLLAELERAFAQGDIPESQFTDELASLNLPDGADTLVRKTVEYRKLVELLDIFRKGVDTGYRFGAVSDAEYVPTLERAGIAERDAESRFFVASSAKHGREAVSAARAAAREVDRERREAIRLAAEQFGAGKLDETLLTAALLAAGVGPAEAALLVGLALTRRAGRLRLTFGRLLSPADAEVLEQQVDTIRTQLTRQLITLDDARAQLSALQIPDAESKALVSRWAAAIGSATKTGVIA